MTTILLNVGLGLLVSAAGDALETHYDRGAFLVDCLAIQFPKSFQQRLLLFSENIFRP
jgi:hypothetical protein